MDNTGTALARAFRAIGDPQKRLQNVTGLIDSLSPWERRHARLQLGDSDGLAGFEDLPADIVCVLLRHLHIEDVLACAAVSRRCRATWTEPAVAAPVSVRFFPALRPPYTFSAFRRACRRYFRRRAGKFTSRTDMILPDPYVSSDPFYMQKWERCSALRPDPRLHPDGKYPRPWLDMFVALFACFGGGNIVWYALLDFFVVDNMYTLTRKVVRVPGGTTYPSPVEGKSAASKSLVALQPHSNDRLHVSPLRSSILCGRWAPGGGWVLTCGVQAGLQPRDGHVLELSVSEPPGVDGDPGATHIRRLVGDADLRPRPRWFAPLDKTPL